MLEHLISDGTMKYRDFITGKSKLLNLACDIGAVFADNEKEAHECMKFNIIEKRKFSSSSEIKKLCKQHARKAYYIVGNYGSPRTWKVGDCLSDCRF